VLVLDFPIFSPVGQAKGKIDDDPGFTLDEASRDGLPTSK
jgi:hypothetical protein